MARQRAEHHQRRLQIDGTELRQRLAAVADAIACTEDQVAETMERMALVMPDSAGRLRAHAAQARQLATLERSRAAWYSSPCSPGAPLPQHRQGPAEHGTGGAIRG